MRERQQGVNYHTITLDLMCSRCIRVLPSTNNMRIAYSVISAAFRSLTACISEI